MRLYAAAFVVMALAALRGIDAQRSRFTADHIHYFSAVAWNSKKKRPMPWACPKVAFGFDIYEALRAGWQGRDYLFVVVAGTRGCNLDQATGFGDSMASAYVILRHYRFLMDFGKVPAEVSQRVRRHSFRHFPANVARVCHFSDTKKSQTGRWADLSVMPIRYAQDVEFLTMVDIIMEVVEEVAKAFRERPVEEWPLASPGPDSEMNPTNWRRLRMRLPWPTGGVAYASPDFPLDRTT